jgi:hypothetical protein
MQRAGKARWKAAGVRRPQGMNAGFMADLSRCRKAAEMTGPRPAACCDAMSIERRSLAGTEVPIGSIAAKSRRSHAVSRPIAIVIVVSYPPPAEGDERGEEGLACICPPGSRRTRLYSRRSAKSGEPSSTAANSLPDAEVGARRREAAAGTRRRFLPPVSGSQEDSRGVSDPPLGGVEVEPPPFRGVAHAPTAGPVRSARAGPPPARREPKRKPVPLVACVLHDGSVPADRAGDRPVPGSVSPSVLPACLPRWCTTTRWRGCRGRSPRAPLRSVGGRQTGSVASANAAQDRRASTGTETVSTRRPYLPKHSAITFRNRTAPLDPVKPRRAAPTAWRLSGLTGVCASPVWAHT